MKNIYVNGASTAYASRLEEAAYFADVPYIDTPAILGPLGREVIADDGYHPNALGHAMLFEAVHETLELMDAL